MKMLIVGVEQVAQGERYMDDKGWSFGRAFKKLGAEVDPFFYKNMGRLSFMEKDKRIKGWWRAYMNRGLQRAVIAKKPDVLLLLKAETVEAETLRAIRKKTDTLIINVFPDNPLLMGNVEGIDPCHLYFVKDTYVVSALKRAGYGNVHYLPQCTDPEVHRPVELTEGDREEFVSEVSLIGSMYPYRHKLMEELLAFKPAIWGRGWGKSPNERLRGLWRGKDIRGSQKAKAICGSAVSLNPHHPLNDIAGVNRRTFDIAACGGFQLADMKEDMGRLFKVGEEIVCFSTMEELKKQIAYYLNHSDERADIARAAHRRAINGHTYGHRAGEILEIVKANLPG